MFVESEWRLVLTISSIHKPFDLQLNVYTIIDRYMQFLSLCMSGSCTFLVVSLYWSSDFTV